jgi:hypothetical protein
MTDPEQYTLDEVRRRREGVRAAVDELERALAAPAAGRPKEWSARVQGQIAALRRAWAHHVNVTEAEGGLFEQVVVQAPRLDPQIQKLRKDHLSVDEALTEMAGRRAGDDPDADAAELGELALAVMGRIVRHRNQGAGLLYEAYCVDIDAAD